MMYATERERELYQAGLVDLIQDRPSLVEILALAEEIELLIAYGDGRIAGKKLLEIKA